MTTPVASFAAMLLASFLSISSARAQDAARPPEECGMTEAAARYGLAVGATVTLQRHRFVRGDDNWDERMSRFVGRAGRVTRLSGVDAMGCPGVRVDVDGGEWFWRARDLGVGTGPQPRPAPRALTAIEGAVPQQCHQDDATARYGPATVGAQVVLGRHRMVDGDDNWADEMMQYVGRTARVVEHVGVDTSGCPIIRVDIDGGSWVWRVRDLRVGGGGGGGEGAVASAGVTTDHGRPTTVVGWEGAGAGVGGGSGLFGSAAPQECGLTDDTVQWGPIASGTSITLGRHRDVGGDANWSAEMDPFVGRAARVTQLVGVDDQGCPVVHVDADGGRFFWRIRDMTLPQ